MRVLHHSSNQRERIARRLGLSFHIDEHNLMTVYSDHSCRQASAQEIELWKRVFPRDFSPDNVLPVNEQEIDNCIISGDFYYMNPVDYANLLYHWKYHFEPNTDIHSLKMGFMGSSNTIGCLIFATRDIPIGYFFRSPSFLQTPVAESNSPLRFFRA